MARFPLHWLGRFCAELIFTVLSDLFAKSPLKTEHLFRQNDKTEI
jgi:hypothetical protein